MLRKNTLKQA